MVKIKLKKELFTLQSITMSREAFSNLADIAVEDSGSYWTCVFTDCVYGESATVSEFENYAIDSMNVPRP